MRILVAIDPSSHAQEAVRFVKSVGWPKGSEIFLIHVIEMKQAPFMSPSGGFSSWDSVISQARGKLVTQARQLLARMKKDILTERRLPITLVIAEGLPGAEILQTMQENRIDLIVLGTRGLSNVKRFLLGSTSEWVMREASCSVLLVREKLSQVLSTKAPPQILLATDGSSVARDMLDMLTSMKFATSPALTVAQVVGRPSYLEGWSWEKGKSDLKQLTAPLMKEAEKDAASHLEEIRQRSQELGFKVDTVLRKGDPAEEIVKTAERFKSKLLLVGSKGVKNGKPVPLGGVVRKISRHAPCSVLLVRPNIAGPH